VRHLDMPVICLFVKAATQETGEPKVTEIFYSPEVDVKGGDVLLVQGLLESGITTEFLSRNLTVRGAKSVKVCTLLDRQAGRRVMLQPDYFGFLLDEKYVFGYGLGSPNLGRNLPFIATTTDATARGTGK
jgi:hypoxanthine phosphoribosyltransferase